MAGTFAAASYFLSSLALTVHWMRQLRYVSLFYWSVGHRQLLDGLSLPHCWRSSAPVSSWAFSLSADSVTSTMH